MRRILRILLVLPLLGLLSCAGNGGGTLPAWEEGCMDIHFINTGRGESVLHVFPDGTTMLMDAAGSLLKEHKYMPVEPKPSAEVSSGKVIADYVRHFLPAVSAGRLDYVMLTHFHSDHMGDYSDSLPMHPSGLFRLTSLAEVGSSIPFDRMLLRIVDPERPSTVTLKEGGAARENLDAFLGWAAEEYGASVETFRAAGCDQVVLRHNPAGYPDFRLRNMASGGYVWTGEGEESRTAIPLKEQMLADGGKKALPPENILSCVFLVSYGDFDYFSGGDIQYKNRSKFPYFDIEEPVSRVVGEVEVMKASHHCTSLANSSELLGAARPDVVVANVWRDVQPNAATLGRIVESSPECDIFLTNLAPKNAPNIEQYSGNINSTQGHVVVRVCPGGKRYTVYVLDDTDQEYRVKETYGPYDCKQQ